MTVHPSAQLRNLRGSLFAYLQGLTLTGTPTILPAEIPRSDAQPSPWVRARIDLFGGVADGHASETQLAHSTQVLVSIDLFWRRGEAAPSYTSADIDTAASEIAAAFRRRHIPLYDYVSSPGSPAEVEGARIHFTLPVEPRPLPADGPWLRRQILAEGWFHLRHIL